MCFLTPGVNFINILRANFSYTSALRSFYLVRLSIFFGSKGARKMWMKLTQGGKHRKGRNILSSQLCVCCYFQVRLALSLTSWSSSTTRTTTDKSPSGLRLSRDEYHVRTESKFVFYHLLMPLRDSIILSLNYSEGILIEKFFIENLFSYIWYLLKIRCRCPSFVRYVQTGRDHNLSRRHPVLGLRHHRQLCPLLRPLHESSLQVREVDVNEAKLYCISTNYR